MSADHETWDELAVGWALHALEPEDEAVFARHLPDCARCARTVAETSEVMASLAADLPPAEPSEELRQRLRAAVEHTEQVRRPVLPPDEPADLLDEFPPPERPAAALPPRRAPADPLRAPATPAGAGGPFWRRRLPQLMVAAAAAVIVGLGTWNVVLSTSRQDSQTAAAKEQQMINDLLAPGQATMAPVSNGHGQTVATVVVRHDQAQVVTSGLSENDSLTHTYVLWGMRSGTPVALGPFDVVSPRMDLRTVGSPQAGIDGFDAFAVSLEPGRKAPSDPTDIVAYGQVTS
jgi:anti-sigma-K factor RskA